MKDDQKEARPVMRRTPLPSMVWDELASRGVHSVYDPFMGSGLSLYAFKRNGVRVIGCEALPGAWAAGQALNENNVVRMSVDEIARFVAPRAPTPDQQPRFAPWAPRTGLTAEQTAWLGYWREAFEPLEGSARGLAIVAVGWMIENWLRPLENPAASIAPPGTLGLFLKRVNQWVWDNGQANLALRGSPLQVGTVLADAAYFYLEPPRTEPELGTYLTEAWVLGEPEPDLRPMLAEHPGYGALASYRMQIEAVFERLAYIPLWAVQYRTEDLDSLWGDPPSWLGTRQLVFRQHVGTGNATGEMLCVALKD